MSYIAYNTKRFRPATLEIIGQADEICRDYGRQGMSLTLRQLYYRFIAEDLFPESWVDDVTGSKNTQKNYKRLGSMVRDARMNGLISWRAIEDRTRSLRGLSHVDGPEAAVESVVDDFCIDLWEGQDTYVEVWFEKDALAGVFSSPCVDRDVNFFSCRGYPSVSSVWSAGRRLMHHRTAGRTPIILHFGDHDPSGIDMTRDIQDRLYTFSESYVEVRRIALNMSQVEDHNPPPNPAKLTDSRARDYVGEFGYDSWELDALEPSVLRALVREEVDKIVDRELFSQREEEQEEGRERLRQVSENWDEVSRFLEDL